MDGPVKEMSREDLAARVGTSLGASDWFLIDQKTIDGFADLTQDHYFIHIDPVNTRYCTRNEHRLAKGLSNRLFRRIYGGLSRLFGQHNQGFFEAS